MTALLEHPVTPDKQSGDDQSELEKRHLEEVRLFFDGVSRRDGGKLKNLAHFLPFMFSIGGVPMTLDRHTPMLPLYDAALPKQRIMMCGRQVGKSEMLNTTNLIVHATTPHFRSLYVSPMFEMTRRFSSNYVKPRIQDSPVRSLLQNGDCNNSVLQKTFVNGGIMHFSYALLDCSRVRGLSVDRCTYDEVQMINADFIPIIAETMSASAWARSDYTGTPLTFDNTIQKLWDLSSRSEWLIRCESCSHWNIPTHEFDAERMIGPRDSVRRRGTGLVCAKCGEPLWARRGRWVPRTLNKETALNFPGYHIPQMIMPFHSESDVKWNDFHDKLVDSQMSRAALLNEVFGESFDQGVKMVSMTHLKDASVLAWENGSAPLDNLEYRYKHRICAVDWSGQGKDYESTTAVAVIGVTPSNRLETICLDRIPFGTERPKEIIRVIDLFLRHKCNWFAHDFNGAGRDVDTAVRQMLIIPPERIMPISYVGTGAARIIRLREPTEDEGAAARGYYQYDKTWSIMLLAAMIRERRIVFPKWNRALEELLGDFLNLVVERRERETAADVLLIHKAKGKKLHDDIAHAINFAVGIFYQLEGIPDIAERYRSQISRFRLQQLGEG